MNVIVAYFIFSCITAGVCAYMPLSKPFLRNRSKRMVHPYFRTPECSKAMSYTIASNNSLPMPCIILVNPSLDQNVGSVARAMLNFGVWDLRVVNPSCNILSGAARGLASGADEVLENAKTYDNLKSCIADLHCVYATTCRTREMNYEIMTPSRAAEDVMSTVNHEIRKKYGILFGCEKDGLSTEDVTLANAVISIPTFNQFASINLAQSVNILCYEMWRKQTEIANIAQPDSVFQKKSFDGFATHQDLEFLVNRLESCLDQISYYELHKDKKPRMSLLFRNIINRVSIYIGLIDNFKFY